MDLEWHAYVFTSIDQDDDGLKLLVKLCVYGCMTPPPRKKKIMCYGDGFRA
jgi:hypothetical protein